MHSKSTAPYRRERNNIVRHPFEHIALWQGAIFFMLVCLIWATAVLDLPHIIFGSPPGQFDWISACLLTAAVIVVGFINIAYTYLQQKRILRGMFKVCSYCGKVQVNADAWEKMDTFVAGKTMAQFSHGICPECYARLMRGEKPPFSPAEWMHEPERK